MKIRSHLFLRNLFILLAITGLNITVSPATAGNYKNSGAPTCPPFGWSEGLGVYLDPATPMPTSFSATANDCEFHEWSWEAFIWATAEFDNGIPRFMTFPTPADIFSTAQDAGQIKQRPLKLSTRTSSAHSANGFTEGDGAIVEADGNMLVGQNGYPVYASVHINPSYFNTAKKNMLKDGGYNSQPADSYFDVGAAVFKATWLRLDKGEAAPAGAFTAEAEVPILTVYSTKNTAAVAASGSTETVTVALVGLHVVGYVENHPEFLWGTFEHKLNAPMLPDNTFSPSASTSNPKNYTFYKAGTAYSEVNIPNQPSSPSSPALLSYDSSTGKFSPVTNVVQENKTGGENNSPYGPANIASLNQSSHAFLSGLSVKGPDPQSTFANYNLIGTVWMKPNTYVITTPNWQDLDEANAVGSVNLANSTAETFQQAATNTVTNKQDLGNCFECHNPKSYSFGTDIVGFPKLPARRMAISHVVSEGSPYAVPNTMAIKPPWKSK